jgi:pimeloyl-ACP methyl ester carboxylesterase
MTRLAAFDCGDVTLSCAIDGEGPLVVAVHGFPDDARTFDGVVPSLVGAGFSVARPTLRGYAPSGVAKSRRYDAQTLGEDVVAIANRLSPGAPVRLIGHDWGALAVFAATALAPERFSQLVTMAVPHPGAILRNLDTAQLRRSWYMGFFQLPGVAEARLARDDFAFVDRLWRDWSPGYRASVEELGAVKAGLRGRTSETLAYYRALRSPHALVGRARRLAFAPVPVPALHLHGEDDGCIGASMTRGAERFYRSGYRLEIVRGAGHFLQREKPEEVAAVLRSFLIRGAGSRVP